MNAVITLLDDEIHRQLKRIWSSLRKKVGGTGVASTPFPHFSYQIAEDYHDIDHVSGVLARCAERMRPFTVRTAGLGIFTGEIPVVVLPVVKSLELIRLHEMLWEELLGSGVEQSELYSPDRWMPHITLFRGNPDNRRLPDIVRVLGEEKFDMAIRVDNLSIIFRDGNGKGIRSRHLFTG